MSNGNARVIKTGERVTVVPYRKGYYISVPDNYVYAESSLDFHSPDYHKGYEQAEKDLALTWGDIQLIDHFILQLVKEEREGKDWGDGEKFYTEVLNRFNKSKEE
jgi:hypothetical protein